jgi:hypothetical protein
VVARQSQLAQFAHLATLQRHSPNKSGSGGTPRGVQVDRGSAEKGLRISLIAAYQALVRDDDNDNDGNETDGDHTDGEGSKARQKKDKKKN